MSWDWMDESIEDAEGLAERAANFGPGAVVKPPCLHLEADHQCGTHARYVLDKCRCDDCRATNLAYQRHRRQWTGEFPRVPPPMVPKTRALRHIKYLMRHGMGHKHIAQRAGVPQSAVGAIVWGRKERQAKKIRRETEEAILSVELDLADGAKVPADEARAIVDELLARGWSKAAIGRRVHGPQAYSLQLRGEMVCVSTLRALRRALLEDVPPRRSRHGLHEAATDHRWTYPRATTRGVPQRDDEQPPDAFEEAWAAVKCKRCGEPLAGHDEWCWQPTTDSLTEWVSAVESA